MYIRVIFCIRLNRISEKMEGREEKMEGPREMIHRAALRRKAGRLPVGAGRLAGLAAEAGQESRQAAPKPISRHASYSALMRSHDRVHTQHIARKG